MTIVERPNQEALSRAINIYLDGIRSFLTRNLERVSGRSVEEAIFRSLPKGRAENFAKNLPEKDNPESAIELSYVEHIVELYWVEVFARHFRNCSGALGKLKLVAAARNQVSHPAYRRDLDGIETLEILGTVVSLLSGIGASHECEAVANIRAELENPGEQNKKVIEGYERLEAQYDKAVVELEETQGFLWKVESELEDTNGELKKEKSARSNAERAVKVAGDSICQFTDELQREVAARRDAEELADQTEERLMRTESDLDSMEGKLKKEKAAFKRAEKNTQGAQTSLCLAKEKLELEAAARREAEETAQEESKGRQLAEQATLALQATLQQAEKELSHMKGELKRAQEQIGDTEQARQENVAFAERVLSDKPFDPRSAQYELWLIDEILSGRLDRAALRQLAGDNRLSGRLVYFVQAASSEMNSAAWQGYVAGRQKSLLRNGKTKAFFSDQQQSHLNQAPQH